MDKEPLLPIGIKILDAKGLHNGLGTGESLWITYSNGKYYLKTRSFNYDVDWTLHFSVSKHEAREIVSLGYADWWFNVDESVR